MGRPRVMRAKKRARPERMVRVSGGINNVIPKVKAFTEVPTYTVGLPVKDPGYYPPVAYVKHRIKK